VAAPEFTLRLLASLYADAGLAAEKELDTDDLPSSAGPIVLTGFQEWAIKKVTLAVSVTDQAVTFTAAVLIILLSDEPITVRLAAGETQLPNTRLFVVAADDSDDHVHSTSVLLSNPGANEAHVEAWFIEKKP